MARTIYIYIYIHTHTHTHAYNQSYPTAVKFYVYITYLSNSNLPYTTV